MELISTLYDTYRSFIGIKKEQFAEHIELQLNILLLKIRQLYKYKFLISIWKDKLDRNLEIVAILASYAAGKHEVGVAPEQHSF